MKVIVAAPDDLWEELNTTCDHIQFLRVHNQKDLNQFESEEIILDLFCESTKIEYLNKEGLVFVNAHFRNEVIANDADHVFRINAWPGFLQRDCWEIAGKSNQKLAGFFSSLGKKMVLIPDVTGFPSTRILSMIINEAYFTLADGVSTKDEIDIAMKLGTNYPKGPFEWSLKVGLKRIYEMLQALSLEDKRYTPAALLEQESIEA